MQLRSQSEAKDGTEHYSPHWCSKKDENEGKICAAAEDIYLTLEEAGALDYCDERAALAAAIYREARIKGGERSLAKIVELFDANRYTTQAILDFMM